MAGQHELWCQWQTLCGRPSCILMGRLTWSLNHTSNIWWRHQMETFSVLLDLCAGNSLVTGEFPSQRPMTRSFDVFFDLCLNNQLSQQSWGWWFETPSRSLWRHCNDPYHGTVVWKLKLTGYLSACYINAVALRKPFQMKIKYTLSFWRCIYDIYDIYVSYDINHYYIFVFIRQASKHGFLPWCYLSSEAVSL